MRDDEGTGDEDRSPPSDGPPSEDATPDSHRRDGEPGDSDVAPPGDSADRPSNHDAADPANLHSDDSAPSGSTGPPNSGETTTRGNIPAQSAANRPQRGGPGEQDEGEGWLIYLYDLVSSVAIVLLIGGLLFAASGVWPPMVAIESPSMEPTMERGDLVYVMEADRFPGDGSHSETGVVTAQRGQSTGYEKFGDYGDVIVFEPNGNERRTPIIHRAMLWVEEGERWVERANPNYLKGADSCDDLPDDLCPAPHSGFITKGDNNPSYDQVSGIVRKGPVKPGWVIGTAELHVPYLGQIRLNSAGASQPAAEPPSGDVSPANATTAAIASVAPGEASAESASPVTTAPHPGTVTAEETAG